jgi:hypothetical protein
VNVGSFEIVVKGRLNPTLGPIQGQSVRRDLNIELVWVNPKQPEPDPVERVGRPKEGRINTGR